MFKKSEDPEKEKMRKKLQKHAVKVQQQADLRKKKAQLLRNDAYVNSKMEEEKVRLEIMKKRQHKLIKKGMEDVEARKHELEAFNCFECGTTVNMSNLTCPSCGQLYCQWCGAKMDMMNPGLCPRCKRPPFYTPAQDVITKVEDLAPEERFWEELPECPKCGGAVQAEWDQCPICGAALSGVPSGGSSSKSTPQPDNSSGEYMTEADQLEGDKKKRRKKKSKKRGI